MEYSEVNNFWFEELNPKQWWVKDEQLDQAIRERFMVIHNKAMADELEHWRAKPEGCLAEVIVLDQFSRNIFRGEPGSFASDNKALALARQAIETGADKALPEGRRTFLYMPFMHSEDINVHEEAVKIFSQAGMEGTLEFELKHKKIIERFGRYPHRNEILGRESTKEELEFLKKPGSSF